MTSAEFYTLQFYTWEYRGRGWLLCEQPVHLEPPFIPFFRHGFAQAQIDDGKRPTMLSKFFDSFKEPKMPVMIEQNALNYDSIAPFIYDAEECLQAIRVTFPKERRITPEKMKALLIMLSYTTSHVSFEIIGTGTEIIVQFVCEEHYAPTIETYLYAYFPHCTIFHAEAFLNDIIRDDLSVAVVDFGLQQECVRPIYTAKSYGLDPLIGIIAVLERITAHEQAGIQLLFQPAVNKWSEGIVRSVSMYDGTSFFRDAPEAPQLAKEKVQSPLYGVTIRTFAQSTELPDSFRLLESISFALMNGAKGSANELTPLSTPKYTVEKRIDDILMRTSHRLGMLLNVDELTTLLHFPSESIVSKKLFATTRKTKEVPGIAKGKQFILGENTYANIQTKVTFGVEDRLKHTHIIGATGTGKSTLIANLILQDIKEGNGVVLFDPHGDLVDDIIARIPEERINDVVLVDPSDIEFPVGLNILQAHSDIEKEVLSSDLVAAFRKYATSWGDQMNAVFGNAILALLESTKGGSLNDLRRFLIEKEFRNSFLKTVTDPSVIYYWQKEYPLLKSNSIGPILTRLDTFLRPKSIRNMVVQKTGLDFETLFTENKIVLLKLSQGLIGMENSFLLGSLLLSKIHQAIFRRQQQAIRTPIFIYLDEFQNFITPSIKEMLSGIRKYSVGLILSHQDLQQLQREDGELLNAVLGNVNTRVAFRVGEPDARKLQDGFSGFDYTDLQNLGRGEAIMRIEQPQYDCSLDTIVLDTVSSAQKEFNKEQVRTNTRKQHAKTKEEVEKELFESFDLAEYTKEKQPTPPRQETPTAEAPTKQPPVVQTPKEPILPIAPLPKETVAPETKDISTHRYLQTLIKKMAEARGYTATLEKQLPYGSGNVDVLLTKENKTIAVEICITTDAEWEAHNIEKCIRAGYDTIVSLTTDLKQQEKIKRKCTGHIPDLPNHDVHFFTPDGLFAYLDQQQIEQVPKETIMKGYRVNVTYDAISPEEMDRKRASVTKVVMDSLRKRKK